MALELIAGATFAVLYDRVSRAVDKKVALKYSLKFMKRTLESLRGQAGIIREIGELNEELSLRHDTIDDLETQMIEGTKLICRLSGLGIFTYCCIDGCAEQLDELNRSLERLLESLWLQQARDIKEILKLSRQNHDDLEEMKQSRQKHDEEMKQLVKKLLLQNGRESVEETSASETSTENEGNGDKQVGSLGGLLEAALLALFGVVSEVKDKNMMYRPLLGSIKSTLDCLKPLIEDMEQGNRVLNRPVKELECFRMHLGKGVELVRKCSKNGVFAKCKKKKYTNRLLELDACLQGQLNVLRVQLATDVRETTASIRIMQKMTKQIEESGAMNNQIEMNGPCEVAEPSSPDELNAGLVEPDEQNEGLVAVEAGGDIRVEGSDEVQDQSEIPNRFQVPAPPLFTVGLDVALKEVKMKLLSEDGFTVLGVFGVGGIGKTTLAKMLCHDQEVKDKFQSIFFTTASKWPNLNLVMQELYQALCSQVPTFHNLEARRYLVVLDDVLAGSESILQEFDGLNIPNSKVLITSRYAFPGVGSQYHLKFLNYEDSMSLFQFSVSLGDRSSYIPEDLLRKTVECCKGLPLAITVIGRSLCSQPIEIWQKRIEEYRRGSSSFDSEPEIVVCLQRRWDALNREKNIIKECFVDLASFPEDRIIPAAALIDMWTELYGIDEFQSIGNLQKLDICGVANIVSREEMEVDGSYSDLFVTLDHMLRGLAIHEASEDTIERRNRLIIDIHGDNLPSWWIEQKYQPKNARLLSISTDRMFSSKWLRMQLPNLEVLVLNFQTEKYVLPDFLDKADKLKFLTATNYGSLPAELSNCQLLGSLRNLKKFRLEGVSIDSISKNHIELGSLKKIAFSKCDIGQAFSNSSFRFSVAFPNLDEMNVMHCNDLEELPADIGSLSQLETLSISHCHRLSTLPEGIGNLSKLKRLRVRYGTNLVEFPVSMTKLKSLELLDIAGCINIVEFPEDIGEMSRLRKLNISGCSRLKELPLSVLSLEKLQEVILDKETENLWKPFLPKNTHTRGESRLRTPNTSGCPELVGLNISGCSKCVELPLSVSSVSSLQRVILDEETENIDTRGESRLRTPNTSGCPELVGLNISGCSKCVELPLSVSSVSSLQGVILDEETENLWRHFPLKNNLRVRVKAQKARGGASSESALRLRRRRGSKSVEQGAEGAQNTPQGVESSASSESALRLRCRGSESVEQDAEGAQNMPQDFESERLKKRTAKEKNQLGLIEGWCPGQEPCSLTLGSDVLGVSGATKMEETLIPEVRLKQIEGSGSVVKNQLAIKGISGNHSRNDIVCNASSSAGGSQCWKAEETDELQTDEESLETFVLRRFTFEELTVATENFRSDGIIGMGASGIIFKGWVDEKTLAPSKVGSGMPVAVKKLNPQSMLDFEGWKSEANFVGRLSHPNLVRLLGYCWEDMKLLLVHEFMPKGSLDEHLFRGHKNVEPLSWEQRIKVATGTAQGLAFLHSLEKQIIYRNFKTSQILLDENYNAKLADFGFIRLEPTGGESHVSTRNVGTYGYVAPEYISTGHLYARSDVYSFGVVLLEILTGLRAVDANRPKEQHDLVDWAKPFLSNKKKLKTIMDAPKRDQYSLNAAKKAGQIALICLAPDRKDRPSMKEVVEELEQIQAIEEELRTIL